MSPKSLNVNLASHALSSSSIHDYSYGCFWDSLRIASFGSNNRIFCAGCALGKSHRHSFPVDPAHERAKLPSACIHEDICRLLPVPSHETFSLVICFETILAVLNTIACSTWSWYYHTLISNLQFWLGSWKKKSTWFSSWVCWSWASLVRVSILTQSIQHGVTWHGD